jgi:hypothetical protein
MQVRLTLNQLTASQQLATSEARKNHPNNVAPKKRKNIPPGQNPSCESAGGR